MSKIWLASWEFWRQQNFILRLTDLYLFPSAWYTDPITSVTLVQSLKEATFPSVTLCPENSNQDRWGPVIKVFDHLKIRCSEERCVNEIGLNFKCYNYKSTFVLTEQKCSNEHVSRIHEETFSKKKKIISGLRFVS